MLQPAPATDWAESVAPDEEERHRRFAEEIVALQRRVSRREGNPGRAFHRKQIAGLSATLTVTAGEPELRQGVFAEPGDRPAVVRMSNGAVRRQADVIPDIRGLAISVRGVSGPGALGGEMDRQDFLLINRPAFGFHDSRGFAALLGPSSKGQVALARMFIDTYGPLKGPIEMARLMGDMMRPFLGFATTTFYSAAPIAFGPYAAMIRARPRGARINPKAPQDWARDIADRLRRGPLRYEVQAQFFLDERTTPIEDLRSTWPRSKSPFHTVGLLEIEQQDMDSAAGRALAEQIDADRFDPWAALAEHRPLGEVMRARKMAYRPSAENRAQ